MHLAMFVIWLFLHEVLGFEQLLVNSLKGCISVSQEALDSFDI